MTQFARPDATVTLGTYTVVGAATAHEATDESVLNTGDYVESVLAPSAAAFTVELAPVTDPGTHTGHIVHVVLGKDVAAGARVDALIELLETATVIMSYTALDVSNTATDYPGTATEAQAATITGAGYAGTLRVRVTFTQI